MQAVASVISKCCNSGMTALRHYQVVLLRALLYDVQAIWYVHAHCLRYYAICKCIILRLYLSYLEQSDCAMYLTQQDCCSSLVQPNATATWRFTCANYQIRECYYTHEPVSSAWSALFLSTTPTRKASSLSPSCKLLMLCAIAAAVRATMCSARYSVQLHACSVCSNTGSFMK
jgi:hypothetical protein